MSDNTETILEVKDIQIVVESPWSENVRQELWDKMAAKWLEVDGEIYKAELFWSPPHPTSDDCALYVVKFGAKIRTHKRIR